MASGKITRWNMSKLSSYEQLQYQRERRAMAREQQAKMAAMANSYANIRSNAVAEQGNLVSRAAMTRISKLA